MTENNQTKKAKRLDINRQMSEFKFTPSDGRKRAQLMQRIMDAKGPSGEIEDEAVREALFDEKNSAMISIANDAADYMTMAAVEAAKATLAGDISIEPRQRLTELIKVFLDCVALTVPGIVEAGTRRTLTIEEAAFLEKAFGCVVGIGDGFVKKNQDELKQEAMEGVFESVRRGFEELAKKDSNAQPVAPTPVDKSKLN